MGPRDEAALPTSIAKAAANGDEAAVAAWLDGGGHVDAREAEFQGTLLMIACVNGFELLELLELLLARGATCCSCTAMGGIGRAPPQNL